MHQVLTNDSKIFLLWLILVPKFVSMPGPLIKLTVYLLLAVLAVVASNFFFLLNVLPQFLSMRVPGKI